MKIKNIFIVPVVLAIIVLAIYLIYPQGSAQTGNRGGSETTLNVAATIFPLADIVANVAGEKAEVKLVLPAILSPHGFELSEGQLEEFKDTQVIFQIGQGLDDWALKAKEASETIQIVAVDKGVNLKKTATGSSDPHYWLSFPNAVLIAENVAATLEELDKDNAESYQANLTQFKAELEKKEKELKELLAPVDKKEIITYHPGWAYFAENFGLKIVGTYGENEKSRIPASRLAGLWDTIRNFEVKTLFAETGVKNQSFDSFAKEVGVAVRHLDSGETTNLGSFLDLMQYNADTLFQALKDTKG